VSTYGVAYYGKAEYGWQGRPPGPVVYPPPPPAPRPTTSTSMGDRLYQHLLPLAWRDREHGFALLKFCRTIGQQMQEVEDVIRDTPEGPGWSAIVDINRVPDKYVDWLAQLVGVRLDPLWTYEQKILAIRDLTAWRRGTPRAIVAAAQQWLTGNKTVVLEEQFDGNAYRMNVITYTDETPYPAETERAVRRQKPAAILMMYFLTTGQDYLALRINNADYAEVNTDFADYQSVRDNPTG
jgi:Phage tail protein (Tail_P2_I)